MFGVQRRQRSWSLVLAALMLALAVLACGGEETPTKVGEVPTEASAQEEAQEPGEPAATEVPQVEPTEVPIDEPTEEPTAAGPTTYQIGDIIGMGDVVMVVLGWDMPPGDEFAAPDEGNVFVAVEAIMVNQGDSAESFSSMLQMELKDDTGQRYDLDFDATMALDVSTLDGEISPGERIRGKVGFQVPEDATGLVFTFDPDIWATGKVFVELGPEPLTVGVPTDLPGERAQEMFAVGDIVGIGDVVMVVLGWDMPPGDDFAEPDEGNVFVAVETILVNQGDSAESISSMLQMELKDDTGQRYDLDFDATMAIDESALDGEISPGERIRGKVGFQVPEEATGLVFVFDAEVWEHGKVFVELGPEPLAVGVPTDLPGERVQEMFAVGDVVEIGDLTLTVNEVTNPPGDEFSKPDEGNLFVVVDVTLTNNASETTNVSSMLQMSLKDDTGQGYDVDFMATMASDGSTPDGEIAPGETIRGQVGFQVPNNATGLVFVFDADVWGHGKVFVALP